MKSVIVICGYFLLLFGARAQANEYSDPYSCYGDVCNSDTPAQFCDIVYRLCRRCDEIRSDCFTRHQTFNCTQYCYEIRYEKDVEGLRVAGCQVPPPPEHGRFEWTHTHVPINATLNVTCDEGYELVSKEPIRCGDFSMWNGPQPKCEGSGSTNYVLILVIICGICLLVSVLVNIVFLTPNRFRRWLRKRKKTTKETKPLIVQIESETDVDKKCCLSDNVPNGTGLSTGGTPVAPSAPSEQEIDPKSDNKQPNQRPGQFFDSDKSHDRSAGNSPGSNHTPTEEAHLPTAEFLFQPEHAYSRDKTGDGNVKGPTNGASTGSSVDEGNQRPPADGDTNVRQIINHINNINTEVHVYPPQSTAAGPSTRTSQKQKPSIPSYESDKRPVEETDFLGSRPTAPSQSVSAIQPEDYDTDVVG